MAKAGDPTVKIALVGDAASLKRALGDAESALDKFNAKTVAIGTAVGQIMAQMATAIVGEIGKGITAAKDLAEQFESTQNRIRAAVGTAAGGALYESVKNIYAKTPAGLDEVTAAATRMYQRLSDIGIVGPALEDLTLKLVKLARATGSDVAATADVFSMAVRNWGLSADQTSPALDRILAASQESGVAIGSLLTQITEAGPSMRGLGMSFDEAVTMIAALSENGMDASDVMKAMNKILAESGGAIATPTEAWKALINELAQAPTFNAAMDLAINKFGLTARSAGQFVQNVREGKLSLDDMAEAIAANGASVSGLAAENATASGKIAILWHNVQLAVEPVLIQLTDMAAGFMDALVQKDDKGKVVGLNLARAWDYVVEEWKKAWPQIEAWLGETLGKLRDWVNGTLVPALAEQSIEVARALWGKLGDVGSAVSDALDKLPEQVAAWVNGGGIDRVTSAMAGFGAAAVAWAENLWDGKNGQPGIHQKMQEWVDALTEWVNSGEVADYMQKNGNSILINLAKGMAGAGLIGANLARDLQLGLAKVAGGVTVMAWQVGMSMASQLWQGFNGMIIDGLSTVGSWLGRIASTVWEWVSKFAGEIPGRFVAAASAIWQWLTDAVNDAPGKIGMFLGTIAGNIARITILLPIWLAGAAVAAVSWVADAIPALIARLSEFAATAFGWAVGFIVQLPTWFVDAVEGLIGWIRDAATGTPGLLNEWAGKIWEFAQSLPGLLLDWFKYAWNAMYDVGARIVEGIWDGIVSMSEWLWQKVSDFATNLWGSFWGAFGIGSPAKRMIPIGVHIAEGIGVGITNGLPAVEGAVQGLRNKITGAPLSVRGIAAPGMSRLPVGSAPSSSDVNHFNIYGSADPRLTAWEIIRARRAQTFLAGAA